MSQIDHRITFVRIVAAAAAAVLLSAGACPVSDGDPTGSSTEPRPTTLSVVTGNSQQGIVGQLLTEALVVRLIDQFGDAIAGQTVTFSATQGGGSVGSANVTTDGDGEASTTWTLGGAAGTQQVTATVQ